MKALLVKSADGTKTGGERSDDGRRSVIQQAHLNHMVKLAHLISIKLNTAKYKVTHIGRNK